MFPSLAENTEMHSKREYGFQHDANMKLMYPKILAKAKKRHQTVYFLEITTSLWIVTATKTLNLQNPSAFSPSNSPVRMSNLTTDPGFLTLPAPRFEVRGAANRSSKIIKNANV